MPSAHDSTHTPSILEVFIRHNTTEMVIGIVMMAAMLPTMIGLNEATQGSRDAEEGRRNEARKQRGHLVATCALTQGTPKMRQQVHNAQVQVGLDGKVSFCQT